MYERLSDKALLKLCHQLGSDALAAKRRFAGTLPEVFRRRLYEPKFESIFHFAKVVGGLTEEHVKRVLSIDESCEDKPTMRNLLVTGKVSVHKLKVVSSIATPENEAELAEKVQLLSRGALETFVKDVKNADGLTEPQNSPKFVHVDTNTQETLIDVNEQEMLGNLSPELKKDLISRMKKGININELLTELLQKHDLEIAQEKEKLAAIPGVAQAKSRYVPAKVKKVLKKEHGEKCSIEGCANRSKVIHHTQRFALTKSHNPRYLAPLCKNHHEIAHTIDIKYQEKRLL